MKKKIKMIALDMDGTVLTDDKRVTPYTKRILEQAMEQGIIVLACTGRPASAIPEAFTELKGMQYAISSNGARIVELKENRVIFEKLIDMHTTTDILNIVKKYDTYREVFWDGIGYTSKEMFSRVTNYLSEYMRGYIAETRVFVEDIEREVLKKNQECDKLHIAFSDMNERKRAIQDIRNYGAFELDAAMPMSIEITAPGINKGTGIINLGELLGITREEIMAAGDGMNDASMLRAVGFPVAMGNAVPEIKELAQYITASNNDEGVAKAIEKYVLN
ncbi:MAG: HAD family hydrolase [Eubacteriales bacterium]